MDLISRRIKSGKREAFTVHRQSRSRKEVLERIMLPCPAARSCPCHGGVWRKSKREGDHPHRMRSCMLSKLSRERLRDGFSTLRLSHGLRSQKSQIRPKFLTRNRRFLSGITGPKKRLSQTLVFGRFPCYTTSTASKWLGRPVGH